jgi:hypothetical protein
MAEAARKPNPVSGTGYPIPVDDHSTMDACCQAPHATYPGAQAGRLQTLPIWSCTRWGLPSFFGHPKNGALLPHHFTLTKLFSPYAICAKSERTGRYIFCCTFLRVATTPRYGAPCPVVFGLSSGPCWIRRSSVLLRPCINQICFQYMIR